MKCVSIAVCMLLAGCWTQSPAERQVGEFRQILRAPSRQDMQKQADRFFRAGEPAVQYEAVFALATEKETDETDHEVLYHFFDSQGQEGNFGLVVLVETRSNTISRVMVDKIIK